MRQILYVNKTECQLRMLPQEFAPWETAYDHFRRFRRRGVWNEMMLELNKLARQKKREPVPSYLLIDSQSVKTNHEGECRGSWRQESQRAQRQIAVAPGLIWGVHVHAANGADTVEGCAFPDLVFTNVPSVRALCADADIVGVLKTMCTKTGRRV